MDLDSRYRRGMSSPKSPIQFDKIASVAIQGGGVYGLTLLGQLQGVIDQGYRIVALSGTSAGAIVATLYWAGVPLSQVKATFESLAGDESARRPNTITDLLGGKLTGEPKGSKMVAEGVKRLLRALNRIFGRGEFAQPEGQWILLRWATRVCDVSRGLVRVMLDRASGWKEGGLFPGGDFERWIDEMIRNSPRVKPHLESKWLKPKGDLLTFGDLWSLMGSKKAYFPALTITATNLRTGGLELIDSTNRQYFDIPIATAVRASGGFPGFFTPVLARLPDRDKQNGQGRPCRLVDGGVICNFPEFVFSSGARVAQLGQHEVYRGDVMRPWVNIGLQLVTPPTIRPVRSFHRVVTRVCKLLAGGTRSFLETRLASDTVERYTACTQPFDHSGWPPEYGVLGFDFLSREHVDNMFTAGQQFARDRLHPLQFALPPTEVVEGLMSGLVAAVATAFGDPGNSNLCIRATLLVPQRDKLVLRYSSNTKNDRDRGLTLKFTEGIVGYCFTRRVPILCNLCAFAERRNALSADLPFNLSKREQNATRNGRSWLLCLPVFDPQTANPKPPRNNSVTVAGGVFSELNVPLDGAVFGVLSVDAEFDYGTLRLNNDPEKQKTDPRLKLAYDTLLSTAWSLGTVFDDWFATGSTPTNRTAIPVEPVRPGDKAEKMYALAIKNQAKYQAKKHPKPAKRRKPGKRPKK